MSYDYNAIVSSITYHRHEFSNLVKVGESSTALEQCQSSVDLFTDLSTKCPMTPLLWMQYAHDAGFVVEELMRRSAQLEEEDDEEEKEGDGGKKKGGKDEEEEEREVKKRGAETRKDVLELALEEFPGCAALRLRYLEEVCLLVVIISSSSNGGENKTNKEGENGDEDALTDEKIRQDFENALSYVGCGSHQNDDVYVSRIYRLYIWYMTNFSMSSSKNVLCRRNDKEDIKQQRIQETMDIFVKRANTPMKSENDSLSNELNGYLKKYNVKSDEADNVIGKVEQGRMYVSKLFDSYATLEDEIDVAMERDGIVKPGDDNLVVERENDIEGEKGMNTGINWDGILNEQSKEEDNKNGGAKTTKTYLMGLGVMNTSSAFLEYAKAISHDIYEDDPNNKKNKKRKRNTKNNDENEDGEDDEQKEKKRIREALILSVFERAISECPTVESVWVQYMRHVLRLVKVATTTTSDENKNKAATPLLPTYLRRLESVSNRSVRNCPYSTTLFDLKMKCMDIIAEHDVSIVFDPDKILEVVKKEAIDGKFLPDKESYLKVYLSAIGVIKRRILSKVSSNSNKRYDDADGIDTRKTAKKKQQQANGNEAETPLDAEAEQEVLDIIDDLREIFDEADSYLRKSYGKWTEGRAVLWKDRADAEAYVLAPLIHSLGDGEDDDDQKAKGNDEVERCYEKLVRVHHPSHPDSWLAYIRYVTGKKSPNSSSSHEHMEEAPGSTIAMLRKARGLFRRAMQSVKKQRVIRQDEGSGETGESDWAGNRNYELALHCLCHEYLEFERAFGSEESHNLASKLVKAKIGTLNERNWMGATSTIHATDQDVVEGDTGDDSIDAAATGKRKHTEDEGGTGRDESEVEPAPKRRKTSADNTSATNEENAGDNNGQEQEVKAAKRTNLKEPKIRPEHTVHVGTLDYPAHPFTIRVTNLSPDTEDMDLVDAFRYKCGAIVHAKILREKHHPRNAKGKSKCEGLVQFEERESVEKALKLSEEIGLHEKLIHVGRSHIPAVGLVPPGMHRVSPKGEGRSTKHNLKRKEKMAKMDKSSDKENGGGKKVNEKATSTVEGENDTDKQNDVNDEKGEKEAKKEVSDTKKVNPYITPVSTGSKQTTKGKSSASDILAFRPRGLHGQRHHKVKVSLKDTPKK